MALIILGSKLDLTFFRIFFFKQVDEKYLLPAVCTLINNTQSTACTARQGQNHAFTILTYLSGYIIVVVIFYVPYLYSPTHKTCLCCAGRCIFLFHQLCTYINGNFRMNLSFNASLPTKLIIHEKVTRFRVQVMVYKLFRLFIIFLTFSKTF